MPTEDQPPFRHSADLPSPEELLDGRRPTPEYADVADDPGRKKRRRGGCIGVLVMVLVIAVGVTAVVLDIRKRSRPDPSVRADTMFSDAYQYCERNDTLGRIYVVRGRVENREEDTRSLNVAAELYDKDGAVLARATGYAGVELTMRQLQHLDKADLEAALGAARAIKVPPMDEVEFLLIFYTVPKGVAAFGLSLIP